jgi:ArsR family transcriptional regulator
MQGVQCNCELSDALGLAPNLISHHMNVLCQSGLVTAEHDPFDARWIYYSVDSAAVEALAVDFSVFLIQLASYLANRAVGLSTI